MKTKSIVLAIAAAASSLTLIPSCANGPVTQTNASNSSAAEIARESRAALHSLYAKEPAARRLGDHAAAVLVFPNIIKGGLVLGAQAGNGALIRSGGEIGGYYQTVAASYGLQVGVQKFGYAVFFMNSRALRDLDRSGGWEIGSSPNVVVLDRGKATALTTRTMDNDTYAYFFDQRGLMAGVDLQGSKITRIHPRQ